MKLKAIFFIILCVIIVAFVGIEYININKHSTTKNVQALKTPEITKTPDVLVVTPQKTTSKITVASATLKKDGFLVARQVEDNKLGQVIEISSPLKSGTHKNISITLSGDEIKTVTNSQLIVMIYDDYGDDEAFNDFDMPSLDSNGFMIARYVATGKPIPTNLAESDTSSMPGMNMPGPKNMVKVTYSDKGFSPDKITVSVNTTVEFINQSSGDMWVASDPHPQHTNLPTFDQFRPFKKGSMYRYVFDKKGVWGFHDHLNPSRNGIVTVT